MAQKAGAVGMVVANSDRETFGMSCVPLPMLMLTKLHYTDLNSNREREPWACIHACMHRHMHVSSSSYDVHVSSSSYDVHVSSSSYAYIHRHVHVVATHMHVYMHTCIYIHTYTHACILHTTHHTPHTRTTHHAPHTTHRTNNFIQSQRQHAVLK
jgi:hypothetical protein